MSPSLRSVLRAALAGAIAAATASPAPGADKVAVGTGGSASDAPFYIAYDKGFFKDEGLDVDLIVLDSGAKVIAPLGTSELDVGSGALSVGFWNALIRGVKFRIVADRGHTEPGYLYQTVFMRKDLIDSGQFKSLKDLKGMRMGFAAQGVTSLSLLNEATKFAGIRFEDVTPVYLSFPQQIAAKIAGAGANEVVATMAKSFSMNPGLVREMHSQAVDVNGAVNAASIQKDLDFFLKQGWVSGGIKAGDVIDMSFAQEASAALGPYGRKSQ